MTCNECVPCEADGCTQTAYCLADTGTHPCPHDRTLCEHHNIENCIDCRREAEMEMYRTGQYDPRSDPFYNHNAPKPVDHIANNGGYWWDGSFVPVPKDTP